MADDSPHKRKRTLDDIGDRDQKKLHLDDFGVGIGELHIDVGEKYLLCGLCKDSHFLSIPRDCWKHYTTVYSSLVDFLKRCLMNRLLTVLLTFSPFRILASNLRRLVRNVQPD